MKLSQQSQQIQIKSLDAVTGVFDGVCWAFGEPDRQGDVLLKGCFADSLASYAENGNLPPLLWLHNDSEPVGAWLSLEETEEGLIGTGKVEITTAKGADVYPLLKSGGLSLSIAFTSQPEDSYIEDGIRYFTKVAIIEISLVSVPANQSSVIRSVKSLKDVTNPKEFEALVREVLGLSRRQAKRLTAGGYPALMHCDDVQADEVDEQKIVAAFKAATQTIRKSI